MWIRAYRSEEVVSIRVYKGRVFELGEFNGSNAKINVGTIAAEDCQVGRIFLAHDNHHGSARIAEAWARGKPPRGPKLYWRDISHI